LHLSFASSNRLMRILRSIVGTQSLLVQSREANFAKRRSVGSEFVGDDYRRNEALTYHVKSGLLRLRVTTWAVARIGPISPQPQAAEVEVSLQTRETPEQLLKWLSSGIHRRRPYKRRHNPCIQ